MMKDILALLTIIWSITVTVSFIMQLLALLIGLTQLYHSMTMYEFDGVYDPSYLFNGNENDEEKVINSSFNNNILVAYLCRKSKRYCSLVFAS